MIHNGMMIDAEKVTIDGVKVKEKMTLKTGRSQYNGLEDTTLTRPDSNSDTVQIFGLIDNELHYREGTSTHYKVNLSTNAVSIVSTLPTLGSWLHSYLDNHGGRGPTIINGEIYVITQSNGVYKWNGSAWTQVTTSIPFSYTYMSGGFLAVDGYVHLLSGNSSSKYHYRLNGSTWTQLGNLPAQFYNGRNADLNGMLYRIGNSTSDSEGNQWYRLDPSNDAWTDMGNFSYPCGFADVGVHNDEVHVIGSGTSSYDYPYQYNVCDDVGNVNSIGRYTGGTSASRTYVSWDGALYTVFNSDGTLTLRKLTVPKAYIEG